ncbi:MAG: hypothetical protein WBX01_13690 [Nitrososphaeraceae archaeon]
MSFSFPGFASNRTLPIIYFMASSGIQLGAWEYLKWRHSTGINDSYYRPTENDLLDDYLKVVPH